ncbi:ATP-dependent Clp protease adapter ClpS [candidate division KSB1 bacterium]|nr:ATP-dependent Clp protease adapter ClpS [candidate division KSB1 bacterium]
MSDDELQNDTSTLTQEKTTVDEPKLYRVLLHNDNYTTMDFVVMVLEKVFHKSPAEATRIMLNVHQKGIGVCGIYPRDIAVTKVATVQVLAENNNFPLLCTMEEN